MRATRLAFAAAVMAVLLPAFQTASRATVSGSSAQSVDSLWALRFTTGPGWRADVAPGAQVGFAAHSRNLARLRGEGRILMGGRFADVGLMVIRAGSEGEVRRMLAPDSAVAAGVFQAAIDPWRTIYEGAVPRR